MSNYSERLAALVKDPDNNILLDANEFYDEQGQKYRKNGNFLFELPSGQDFQRKLITLWALFERFDDFNECIDQLAERALDIKNTKIEGKKRGLDFDTIIGCTATTKHILKYLKIKLWEKGFKVQTHYLGPYPHGGINLDQKSEIEGRRILVLTDVITSGNLVRNLVRSVNDMGGKAVGALSVIVDGKHILDESTDDGRSEIIDHRHKEEKSIPVFYLAGIPVESHKVALKKEFNIRKVDPDLILPNLYDFTKQPSDSIGHLKKIVADFQEANCLRFNFFQEDNRYFLTSVNKKRLYEYRGVEIWNEIKAFFPGDKSLLVAPCTKSNVDFLTFVQSNLKKNHKTATRLIPPKESAYSIPFTQHLSLPFPDPKEYENAVLLLASAQTGERLYSIATLIASYGYSKITVICLVNRMGSETEEFVSRVRSLLHGSGNKGVDFYFHTVYRVPDLRYSNHLKLRNGVSNRINYYISKTKVPSFRRWAEHHQKYFTYINPASLQDKGEHFKQSKSVLIKSIDHTASEEIQVKSEDLWLMLLSANVVHSRDYEGLLEALKYETDRGRLFKLLSLLISDLGYIRMTGDLEKLIVVLLDRINQSRKARIRKEKDFYKKNASLELTENIKNSIKDSISRETIFLFSLAMLSYPDHGVIHIDRKHNIMEKVLLVGSDPQKYRSLWKKAPYNCYAHYSEDRIAWAISTLVLFSYKSVLPKKNNNDTVAKLKSIIQEDILKFIDNIEELSKSNDRSVIRKGGEIKLNRFKKQSIKLNLSHLLTELGQHERKNYHQSLRFLQKQIIKPAKHHNYINTTLSSIGHWLTELVTQHEENSKGKDVGKNEAIKFQILGEDEKILEKYVEDAFTIAGLLEEIAIVAQHLFSFTPALKSASDRFTNGPRTFMMDIKQLGDILVGMRNNHEVTEADIAKATKIMDRISKDLWGETSKLQEALTYYVVSLHKKLKEAVSKANEDLIRYGISDIWKEKIPNHEEELFVLCDPFLLTEVIRNLLNNVRHTIKETEDYDEAQFSKSISMDIREEAKAAPEPETGVLKAVTLEIRMPNKNGISKISPGATTKHHQAELQEFDGEIKFEHVEGELCVQLILLHRENYLSKKRD